VTSDPATRFDLLDEPWITVRLLNGRVEDVSLLDAFRRADEIRELGGELPTQSFALLRLLLAILYRAIDEGSLTETRWAGLWENGIPVAEVEDYLSRHRDRFDLLDPERPFFQVAGLRTGKDEIRDVVQLIFDLPSNNRLFTTRAGSGIERLSFAEAARWVVNAQALDPSGIKSGAVGDSRVQGGKGYPIGIAWAGLIGGVFAEGASLRETLLLNLVGRSPYLDLDRAEDDLPPWERTELDGPAERADAEPTGPVSLYTWQSRRIRLVSDGSGVVGSLVANGDRLTPQNLQRYEPMTAWRYSEPQSKKAGVPTYMPREHQPGRALWRGIAALLPSRIEVGSSAEAPRSVPPGLVQWLSRLQEYELLDSAHVIRLHAAGVLYGSNNSVVGEIIDDRMLVSLALLSTVGAALAEAAENAVSLADKGAWELRRLAENLERAGGGEGGGARSRADEAAYSALDAPYRRWLAGLGPETDPAVALAEWKELAKGILLALGDELVASAGPAAWVGREVTALGRTDYLTTSRAENWFRLGLHRVFGTPGEESVA